MLANTCFMLVILRHSCDLFDVSRQRASISKVVVVRSSALTVLLCYRRSISSAASTGLTEDPTQCGLTRLGIGRAYSKAATGKHTPGLLDGPGRGLQKPRLGRLALATHLNLRLITTYLRRPRQRQRLTRALALGFFGVLPAVM